MNRSCSISALISFTSYLGRSIFIVRIREVYHRSSTQLEWNRISRNSLTLFAARFFRGSSVGPTGLSALGGVLWLP